MAQLRDDHDGDTRGDGVHDETQQSCPNGVAWRARDNPRAHGPRVEAPGDAHGILRAARGDELLRGLDPGALAVRGEKGREGESDVRITA